MKTPNDDHNDNDLNPDHSTESLANDRFIHGLLGFIHQDSKAEKERRIQRVLNDLGNTDSRKHHQHKLSFRRFVPLASAAMIMMIAFTLFVLSPQPNAYAIVNSAIEATQSSTTLRYEIKKFNNEGDPIGTLDMRGNLSRVHISTPRGHDFIMGRDDLGEWSIRRDGTIERHEPRGAAPRWLNLGESTILIASLDEFLIQLKDDYAVEIVPDQSNDIIRLNALRKPSIQKPGPDQISVWIDPNSLLVDRLELSWIQGHRDQSKPRPRQRPRPETNSERSPPNHPPPPPHHQSIEDQWFPELIGTPPMFDMGRNPPPPPLIIFQRVDPIDLPVESYSPPSP